MCIRDRAADDGEACDAVVDPDNGTVRVDDKMEVVVVNAVAVEAPIAGNACFLDAASPLMVALFLGHFVPSVLVPQLETGLHLHNQVHAVSEDLQQLYESFHNVSQDFACYLLPHSHNHSPGIGRGHLKELVERWHL